MARTCDWSLKSGEFKSETRKAVQVVHCPVFDMLDRCPAGRYVCLCLMEDKQVGVAKMHDGSK